jgi:hypothetical protein
MAAEPVFWLIITPAGTVEVRIGKPSLEDLQKAVGGDIEAAYVDGGGFTALCNEEGKLQGLPYNRMATKLCGTTKVGDILVGDVVLIGNPDKKGESTPLPDDIIAMLLMSIARGI